MKRDIILVLIGFFPALLILLITEAFQWSQERRNFLSNKYENAIGALVDSNTILENYRGIYREAEKIPMFIRDYTVLERGLQNLNNDLHINTNNQWKISNVEIHDSSLKKPVDTYFERRNHFINSLKRLQENAQSRMDIKFVEIDILGGAYAEAYQDLLNHLFNRAQKVYKNPLYKIYFWLESKFR